MEKRYAGLKAELKTRPKELTRLDQWLFVAVNTAKSILDNNGKAHLDRIEMLAKCGSTRELQYEFDRIQGEFGREGFSRRHSPVYQYLCSLTAQFPDQRLSEGDRELILQYAAFGSYLLYEL